MGDLAAATIAILDAAGVADGRVFGVELPDGEIASMPRKCAVVRPAGGATSTGYMPTGRLRLDVRCYGATPYEAAEVEAAVAAVLHHYRGGVTVHGRVHWFRQAGGINHLRDPDTDWPLALSVWQAQGDRYA